MVTLFGRDDNVICELSATTFLQLQVVEEEVKVRVRTRREHRVVMVGRRERREQEEQERAEEASHSCECTSQDRRSLSQEPYVSLQMHKGDDSLSLTAT